VAEEEREEVGELDVVLQRALEALDDQGGQGEGQHEEAEPAAARLDKLADARVVVALGEEIPRAPAVVFPPQIVLAIVSAICAESIFCAMGTLTTTAAVFLSLAACVG
jgi:hypothetical protein